MENQIINLLKLDYLTLDEIAFYCECSRTKVMYINNKYNIRKPKHSNYGSNAMDKEMVEKILICLKDKEMSMKEIASECNCSLTTIYRYNRIYKIRSMKNRNNKIDCKVIYLLKNSDLSMSEISKETGISLRQVRNINEENGKIRVKKIDPETKNKIINLLKNTNQSMADIAKECNVGHGTIYNINALVGSRKVKSRSKKNKV